MHRLTSHLRQLNWRLILIQTGILLTLALIPVWYRLPETPIFFVPLYFSRFLILLPMVWTIGVWLLTGLPGFAEFRRSSRRSLFALALLSLAVWVYASQGWAWERIRHPEVAQNAGLQFCVVALFVVVVLSAGPPTRAVVAVMIVSLVWNSAITALQVVNQGSIGLRFLGEFVISPNQQGVSVIQSGDLRWLRPYGLLPHPNLLGGVFAVCMLAAAAWIISARGWRRWWGFVVFLLGLWMFFLTFSRGAWLGFAAGAVTMLPLLVKAEVAGRAASTADSLRVGVYGLLHYVRRQRLLVFTVVLSMAVAGLFFVMYRPLLIARSGDGQQSLELRSVSDRLVFTEFAFRSIRQKPLLGVGVGNFPWRTTPFIRAAKFDLRGDNVHNVLLSVWAELGLVGLGLMLTALVVGVEAALTSSVLRRGDLLDRSYNVAVEDHSAQAALFGGFIALTVIGLLDHYPYTLLQFQTAWWALLALAMRPHGAGTPTSGRAKQAPRANTTSELTQTA